MATGRTSKAIEQWRARILDIVLMIAFAASTIAVGIRAVEDVTYGSRFESLYLLPAWLVIATGCWYRRASFNTRKVLLVVGCILVIAFLGARGGFLLPNTFVASLMVSIWGSLFLEHRGTWMTWGATIVTWIGVAVFCVVNEVNPSGPALDPSLPSSWVRILVIYGTISFGTVASVRYLVTRMEASPRHAEALVEALEPPRPWTRRSSSAGAERSSRSRSARGTCSARSVPRSTRRPAPPPERKMRRRPSRRAKDVDLCPSPPPSRAPYRSRSRPSSPSR